MDEHVASAQEPTTRSDDFTSSAHGSSTGATARDVNLLCNVERNSTGVATLEDSDAELLDEKHANPKSRYDSPFTENKDCTDQVVAILSENYNDDEVTAIEEAESKNLQQASSDVRVQEDEEVEEVESRAFDCTDHPPASRSVDSSSDADSNTSKNQIVASLSFNDDEAMAVKEAESMMPYQQLKSIQDEDKMPIMDKRHTDHLQASQSAAAPSDNDTNTSNNPIVVANRSNSHRDNEVIVIKEKDLKVSNQTTKSTQDKRQETKEVDAKHTYPSPSSSLANAVSNVGNKESDEHARLANYECGDEVVVIEGKDSKVSSQQPKSSDDKGHNQGLDVQYTDASATSNFASLSSDSKKPYSHVISRQRNEDDDHEVILIGAKEPKLLSRPKNSSEDGIQMERAKRKREVNRLLRPGVIPSFVALISPDDDSPEDIRKQPARIVVDVDEFLGLKHLPKAIAVKSEGNSLQNIQRPDVTPSFLQQQVSLPADEGWYEGVVPMALPDDHLYMNEFHRVIRANLELFSATASDVAMTQAGRRAPVVLGKVGMRCIHCAKAALEKTSEPDSVVCSGHVSAKPSKKLWPAGSISYPVNIAGLYPNVSQKPAMHFEHCPNLPINVRAELYRITNDSSNCHKRQRKAAGKDGGHQSMSTATAYAVAAKRLGLVDTKNGIRFGRDLSLEPLLMEAALAQVQQKQTNYRKSPSIAASPNPRPENAPRLPADEDSERVLSEAVAESDDGSVALGRVDDRGLVSDFVFLCIKQMAICHAGPADFASRGKKTKLMKNGFAGFCCKHCSHIQSTGFVHSGNFSCRSFASAPDNLASAISSSFYSHLQKCFLVPREVKKALAAYKRLHSRQLSRLPHGSQRQLFHLIWARLRAADRTEEEMEETADSRLQPHQGSATATVEGAAVTPVDGSSNVDAPDMVTSAHWMVPGFPESRPQTFPICKDEETQRVLMAAEEEQDPSANDNLLLPGDRYLITDFVFLLMKQLRVAQPTFADFSRGRRSTVLNSSQAGLGCKHCMEQDKLSAGMGRSFPSQADNLASSLNTSMHQHIQKCPYVRDDVKRSITNLKKMHSTQLSHLRFGSQRRFFHLLFARLSKVEVQDFDITDHCVVERPKGIADDDALETFGFIKSTSSCFQCQNCRMVPLELRAPGSLVLERPTLESIKSHSDVCKGDRFDLRVAAGVLHQIVQSCPSVDIHTVTRPSFKSVVRELVGGNEQLVDVFTTGVAENLSESKDGNQSSNETGNGGMNARGLWCHFPATVDVENTMKAFEVFANDVVPSLSPCVTDNPLFVRYFRTISPSLLLPGREKEAT